MSAPRKKKTADDPVKAAVDELLQSFAIRLEPAKRGPKHDAAATRAGLSETRFEPST